MKGYFVLIQAVYFLYSLSGAGAAVGPMDSAAVKNYQRYVETYTRSLPFVETAKSNGIRVEPASVGARLAAYREMYPGLHFDSLRVENQMLAEGYLEKLGIQASDESIGDRLDGFGDDGQGEANPRLEAIKQALKAEQVLNSKEVVEKGEKQLDLTFLRNQDIMESGGGRWNPERLRLQGAASECMAWLEETCFATLGEFNGAAMEYPVPEGVDLDSARAMAFRRYLQEKYYGSRSSAAISSPDTSAILESARIRKMKIGLSLRMRSMGRQVTDPRALQEAYDKYYRKYFKARDEIVLGIIGSSDSAYIDSVHGVMVAWEAADKLSRESKKVGVEEPTLPWLRVQEKSLPAVLVALTDTFHQGQFTRPVKTRFGIFVARVLEINRKPEIPFQAAQAQLIFLATRDKYMAMDSVLEARSRRYYTAHPDEFTLADTLALRAWLLPIANHSRPNAQAPLQPDTGVKQDTLRFSPLRISSLDLPEKVRKQLAHLARNKPRKVFFGPLQGEHGRWYFRIEGKRKAGGIQPFSLVKDEIKKKLGNLEVEPEPAKPDTAGDIALLNLALSRESKARQFDVVSSLSQSEIEVRLKEMKIDVSNLPDGADLAERLEVSRERLIAALEQRSQAEKRQGLKEIRINYARLFQ